MTLNFAIHAEEKLANSVLAPIPSGCHGMLSLYSLSCSREVIDAISFKYLCLCYKNARCMVGDVEEGLNRQSNLVCVLDS